VEEYSVDKHKKTPFDTDLLDRLDMEIENNHRLFEENLKKAKKILSGAMPEATNNRIKAGIIRLLEKLQNIAFRLVVRRQNQMNALIINMLQDLSRLQVYLADRASARGQMSAQSSTGGNLASFLYMVNHPIYHPDRTKPCVVQIVASLNFGDAVGNDVLAVKQALEEEGYLTAVYAGTIHSKIRQNGIFYLSCLPELKKTDTVIYHFAAADPFAEEAKRLKCKMILRYHNVTPPKYFHGFDAQAEYMTQKALQQVKGLGRAVESVMAVSEFNKQDLAAMKYPCPMETVPILIPFSDYEQEPDPDVIKQYSDGRTNVIFVGRGAPNKKIEDVIKCFLAYKRTFNARARLFLVGSYEKTGKYYAYLQHVLKKEHASDVIFPGHISFQEILAYYRIADVFLCMSEHEGFCVPLVEAMYFQVPIVAYAAAAVPETLGKAGVLVHSKEPGAVARKINRIVTDRETAVRLTALGLERLEEFRYENVKKRLIHHLEKITGCAAEKG